MVIVQGKVQGDTAADSFVNLWGGLMGSKPATKGVSRVQRVQGALGGILKEIGFTADQVFLIWSLYGLFHNEKEYGFMVRGEL